MATTVYLHRALAHRALTLRPPAAHVFRLVVWVTTGIRPRQWVAVHRKHHAFTDVEGDPHSPVLHGWVKVQLMNVAMYRREARNPRTIERYARTCRPPGSTASLYDHAMRRSRPRRRRPVRGVRVEGRIARRLRPRQRLPCRLRGGERDRPPLRPPALRQQRRQSAMARLRDRRRRAAQQPPCQADARPSCRTAGSRSTPGGG